MAREIVTSENREEFMEKKLKKDKMKKMNDELYEKARKHPKFETLKVKFGKKDAMDMVLNQMNMGDSETSLPNMKGK
jgi:hypothetical protein